MSKKPVFSNNIEDLINEDNENLSEIASSIIENNSELIFKSYSTTDKENGLEQLKKKNGIALIIINKNFSSNILNSQTGNLEIFWIMEGAGIMDSISSEVVQGIIYSINHEISKELIKNNLKINASIVLSPTKRIETTYFKEKEMPGISPSIIIGMLSSQSTLIPIIIVMIILMAGGTVISSMALEKENKTLETLLQVQ